MPTTTVKPSSAAMPAPAPHERQTWEAAEWQRRPSGLGVCELTRSLNRPASVKFTRFKYSYVQLHFLCLPCFKKPGQAFISLEIEALIVVTWCCPRGCSLYTDDADWGRQKSASHRVRHIVSHLRS